MHVSSRNSWIALSPIHFGTTQPASDRSKQFSSNSLDTGSLIKRRMRICEVRVLQLRPVLILTMGKHRLVNVEVSRTVRSPLREHVRSSTLRRLSVARVISAPMITPSRPRIPKMRPNERSTDHRCIATCYRIGYAREVGRRKLERETTMRNVARAQKRASATMAMEGTAVN